MFTTNWDTKTNKLTPDQVITSETDGWMGIGDFYYVFVFYKLLRWGQGSGTTSSFATNTSFVCVITCFEGYCLLHWTICSPTLCVILCVFADYQLKQNCRCIGHTCMAFLQCVPSSCGLSSGQLWYLKSNTVYISEAFPQSGSFCAASYLLM